MGRPPKTIDETLNQTLTDPILAMPLTTMREYRQYNEAARAANKKLRLNRYPIKQCPIELHPTERVVFQRADQPSNPLKVYISDEKIEFKETLVPGKVYDLPKYVVSWLAGKGKAVWSWKTNPDGSSETFVDHKEPRFALKTIYTDDYE